MGYSSLSNGEKKHMHPETVVDYRLPAGNSRIEPFHFPHSKNGTAGQTERRAKLLSDTHF